MALFLKLSTSKTTILVIEMDFFLIRFCIVTLVNKPVDSLLLYIS